MNDNPTSVAERLAGPVTVAARLGSPQPTTELALAASAVVPTPGGPAVLLDLEQVRHLMAELAEVVAFYDRTPAMGSQW